MTKTKSLNICKAEFTHKGRKYEIDLLLDSMGGGFAAYDIFDVTDKKGKNGNKVGQFYVEQHEEDEYLPSQLIEEAKVSYEKD